MNEIDPALPSSSPESRLGRSFFWFSLIVLVCSSLFAGAMVRPAIDRWRSSRSLNPGELAAFLEHTAVDVRLGRAGGSTELLERLAHSVKDPAVRERVLGLWAEAALQSGRMSDAAKAEELREPILSTKEDQITLRLRRIGLAAALGEAGRAEELARPLLGGKDPSLADEARLRLLSGKNEKDLRSWVAGLDPSDQEAVRRGGFAALRLLRDATAAEKLLGTLEGAGQRDASLLQALTEAYSELRRPQDLARVAGLLLNSAPDDASRARIALAQANALADIGDARAALALLDPLSTSRELPVRQAARLTRLRILAKTGRLEAELASLRDPAEKAFVALEVERDYAKAARLYEVAIAARPSSMELSKGLREAQRKRDLADRRALYEQLLAKDPADNGAREKLLATWVALGDDDAVRAWVGQVLKGRENSPEVLFAVGLALRGAGLENDAVGFLERAHSVEPDVAKKQQILFALGDLYASSRHERDARRLYTTLASEGASAEIRERAAARLVSLLR